MIKTSKSRRTIYPSERIHQIINTNYNKEELIKKEQMIKLSYIPPVSQLGCCCIKCKTARYNTFEDCESSVLKDKVHTSKL